jgi:hypothetical protein
MQCIPDEDPSFLSQLMPNVLQPWEACNALHNPKVSSSSHEALHQMLPATARMMLRESLTRYANTCMVSVLS